MKKQILPLLSLFAVLALSGCSWLGLDDWGSSDEKPPEATRDFSKFPYEQMAPEAPPAPRAEIPPPQPSPPDEFAWRPGHYSYKDGVGFVWEPGYWIRKPAFTAAWKPDFWMQHTYGWSLVPGHWE